MKHGKIKIFSGNASRILAKEICIHLGIQLSQAEVGRFSDGEVKIKPQEEFRDCDVFIINSTQPPAENIFELALLADAAIGSSASRVTLVIPYLGYNRQDRKDKPRVPMSARYICQMLSLTGAQRVLLLDLHSEPTAGFFDRHIVVDHLYSSKISVDYLKSLLKNNFVVASPDKGGTARAEAYSNRLGLSDCVVFNKRRPKENEVDESSIKIIGDVKNKDILFVDDIIDTAKTIIGDAKAAKKAGAKNLYVFGTHGLFSDNAIAKLDKSPIKEIVITDTIYHKPEELKTSKIKITVLSVAQLLAQAIHRIHEGESVSSLII
ncbi:MAG: ribose-phosphate diphosphokinase [Patescibacteria group bacterium]